MNNQPLQLGSLIKEEEEEELGIDLKDDKSPLLEFFKEEDDIIFMNSDHNELQFSNLIKSEYEKHDPMVENVHLKDELYTNSNDESPILVFIKEEENFKEIIPIKDEHCTSINSVDESSIIVFIKEEDDFNYEVHSSAIKTTSIKDEFCTEEEDLKPPIFNFIKEEGEIKHDISNFIIETTSYEDQLSVELEDDKSPLIELIKEKYEYESELLSTSIETVPNGNTENIKLPLFEDEEFATSFLINKNLLADNENSNCHKCGSDVKYYTRLDRGKWRKVLRCKRKGCQTTQSLRKDNSFWSRTDKNGRNISKLSISAQLQLVYYWCQHFSASTIISLTGKSSNTVYNWMTLCQEVPLRLFDKRSKLGGSGISVNIDHYLLSKLQKNNKGSSAGNRHKDKYINSFENRIKNYGKLIKGPWVFVLCDANERRYFILENRDKVTLKKIIKQEVNKGSTIRSDNWEVYSESLQGKYVHEIVNINKDNKDNPSVNDFVKKMEKLWIPLKLFYKHRRCITTEILKRYLIEIWWRNLCSNKIDPFDAFLRDMAEVF